MKHAKRGYILFLLFTILSVCSVLISLYFSQVLIYNKLMHMLITKEKATRLAMSSTTLAQALLTSNQKEEKSEKSSPAESEQSDDQKVLTTLFDCWNKESVYDLTQEHDGLQATIKLCISGEQGKLNLNSLYDFEKKKFLFEGTPQDRKKICVWLFEKIATITKKPSLFAAFEQCLAKRDFDFNDVCELITIKEFATAFDQNLFLTFAEKNPQDFATQTKVHEPSEIFLTDIFTVSTEQETINPWLFSHSWCKILDLNPKKKLTDEEKKKFFSEVAKKSNWESDWNKKLKDFYQKDFKDLPVEIKTILTTEFEANIFSLLLKVNIGETNSTIFTIVKSKAKDRLINFEIVKNYQI